MIAQLKKGILEFCILLLLSKQELYGYEIMKKITEAFPDTGEQTVYTILRRLLSDECTMCFSKGVSEGPPRKYYRLTQKGEEYLQQCSNDWNYVKSAVDKIIQM